MAVLYDNVVASYDDSVQPTGTIHWGQTGGLIPLPVPHVEMKKLHHELHLIISGPDGSDVSGCVRGAAFVGLLAGLITAYTTGGLALPAAEQAAIAALLACLGDKFQANFQDESHWVTWDT
jgi:hypothetical protein